MTARALKMNRSQIKPRFHLVLDMRKGLTQPIENHFLAGIVSADKDKRCSEWRLFQLSSEDYLQGNTFNNYMTICPEEPENLTKHSSNLKSLMMLMIMKQNEIFPGSSSGDVSSQPGRARRMAGSCFYQLLLMSMFGKTKGLIFGSRYFNLCPKHNRLNHNSVDRCSDSACSPKRTWMKTSYKLQRQYQPTYYIVKGKVTAPTLRFNT